MRNPLEPILTLAAAQPLPAPVFRYATVTGVSPPRVRLDGDDAEVPSTPATLVPLEVGQRVRVMLYGRALEVVGVVGGVPAPEPPLVPADNMVIVGGREYQFSGRWPLFAVSAWSSVSSGGINVATWSRTRPYVPPSGYGFEAFLLESSGFGFLSTTSSGETTTTVVGRYVQFFNASFVSLRVGWRLTRLD